jgi:ADP-ribose pyrophosphatase YjhB (NUDIX family)
MLKRDHKITEEEQLKELNSRVPPILNVDIVIFDKGRPEPEFNEGKYLIGHRNVEKYKYENVFKQRSPKWLFPGGRVRYDESPQEAAERILKREVPGIKVRLRKLITAVSDKGYDCRAYGVTIYMLYEHESGTPKINDSFDDFRWLEAKDIKNSTEVYDLDISVMNEIEATVRTMYVSQDEELTEVDKNDKIIGAIIKREAHTNPKRFHRAAHIMIFNSKGQVVLQQRSLSKSSGAGMWDMHGGHQVSGQTIEQTAIHELAEELGVQTKLQFVRKGLYQSDRQSEFYYLYYGIDDGPFGFDRSEVQQIKTFDCQKMLDKKYDKDYDILPHVYGYVEELRPVWQKLLKK